MKADQIKKWRQRHKLSQADLAGWLEVDVMTISRWERGESTAPRFLALALEAVGQRLKGKNRK